jgi:DNA-binding MarR family transcriptional regulator
MKTPAHACQGLGNSPRYVNMADQYPKTPANFLREGEIRRGVELLYFGYSHLTGSIDAHLATLGLGRAHHRTLYFIARQPNLTVSELLKLLNITKQSLGRVVNELLSRDLIENRAGKVDRRQRRLSLTPTGIVLEAELFEKLRAQLSNAYQGAGTEAVSGFWQVLEGLVPTEQRDMVFALHR